jgi:hypothetical protein
MSIDKNMQLEKPVYKDARKDKRDYFWGNQNVLSNISRHLSEVTRNGLTIDKRIKLNSDESINTDESILNLQDKLFWLADMAEDIKKEIEAINQQLVKDCDYGGKIETLNQFLSAFPMFDDMRVTSIENTYSKLSVRVSFSAKLFPNIVKELTGFNYTKENYRKEKINNAIERNREVLAELKPFYDAAGKLEQIGYKRVTASLENVSERFVIFTLYVSSN